MTDDPGSMPAPPRGARQRRTPTTPDPKRPARQARRAVVQRKGPPPVQQLSAGRRHGPPPAEQRSPGGRKAPPPLGERSPGRRSPADDLWRRTLAILFNLGTLPFSRAEFLRRSGLTSRQLARLERGAVTRTSPTLHAAIAALAQDPRRFLRLVDVVAVTIFDSLLLNAAAPPTRQRSTVGKPTRRKATARRGGRPKA